MLALGSLRSTAPTALARALATAEQSSRRGPLAPSGARPVGASYTLEQICFLHIKHMFHRILLTDLLKVETNGNKYETSISHVSNSGVLNLHWLGLAQTAHSCTLKGWDLDSESHGAHLPWMWHKEHWVQPDSFNHREGGYWQRLATATMNSFMLHITQGSSYNLGPPSGKLVYKSISTIKYNYKMLTWKAKHVHGKKGVQTQ